MEFVHEAQAMQWSRNVKIIGGGGGGGGGTPRSYECMDIKLSHHYSSYVISYRQIYILGLWHDYLHPFKLYS